MAFVFRKLNIDQINIVLMLISCVAAFLLPFELVLVSYAFLGPAHYLTQISWLHDRSYFIEARWLWIPFSVLTCLLIWLFYRHETTHLQYIVYCLVLGIAFGLTLARNWIARFILGASVVFVLLYVKDIIPDFAMALMLLLPTVVHVYLFTGLFILLGALRSRSIGGISSFVIFICCGISFFLATPPENIINPEFVSENIGFFQGVADYLANALSFGGTLDSRAVLGFLSFAYTYHYLNWFSKVEIIKWHKVPLERLFIIVSLYVLSIGLYLYDYKSGFINLLFLSMLHVLLEFPLNIHSIKSLSTIGFTGAKSIFWKSKTA